MTLTIAEIRDLAELAGLRLDQSTSAAGDVYDMETEITVAECPQQGIRDENHVIHCKHMAYFSEYLDEGVCPLGPTTETEVHPESVPQGEAVAKAILDDKRRTLLGMAPDWKGVFDKRVHRALTYAEFIELEKRCLRELREFLPEELWPHLDEMTPMLTDRSRLAHVDMPRALVTLRGIWEDSKR